VYQGPEFGASTGQPLGDAASQIGVAYRDDETIVVLDMISCGVAYHRLVRSRVVVDNPFRMDVGITAGDVSHILEDLVTKAASTDHNDVYQ
jgi:hypothetical protein